MTKPTTESERLVTEYCRCWNEREFSNLSDVVTESFTLTSPTAGTLDGRDTVIAHVRSVIEGFPDYQITLHETIVGEDVVVAESRHSGTHEGEFNGIPPTNEAFEVPVMAKFVVKGDNLVEEHAYFDLYDVLSQLGLVNM